MPKTKRRRTTAVQNLNTTSELQVNLSRCVGKICAYQRVCKNEEAKVWAVNLTIYLQNAGLIPPITTALPDTVRQTVRPDVRFTE